MSRHPLLAIAVIAFLAAGIAGYGSSLVVKDQISTGSRQQRQALRQAQVKGCQRQNIRTAALNRNANATWRLNTLFASALTQPSQHPQTAREKRLTHRFHGRLVDLVASLTWTPLNSNCVGDPTQIELPVRFADHAPSPVQLRSPK